MAYVPIHRGHRKGRRLIQQVSVLRVHQLAYRKEKGRVRNLQSDRLRRGEWASVYPDKDNEIHGNSTALLVFGIGKAARGDGVVTHVRHYNPYVALTTVWQGTR